LDFSPASNEIDFSSSGAADTEISLEGVASEGALPGWDETTTKLDLAKAYIDMGDSEGARSILDEVMAEGNDSQKRQARDLAAQIAA
jgi:pilus assembly protein FimV